jgi:hypothetical protein
MRRIVWFLREHKFVDWLFLELPGSLLEFQQDLQWTAEEMPKYQI